MQKTAEATDDLIGYKIKIQIRFKTSVLKFSLSEYSVAYILLKETITITGLNWTSFTNCISEIINTQVDDAQETF